MENLIVHKLTESGLSRIEQWMSSHDICCISACRGNIMNMSDGISVTDRERFETKFGKNNDTGEHGVFVDRNENKVRTRNLKSKLLALGYGVTAIGGNYIEDFGTPNTEEVQEDSFFVVNLKDDPNFFKNCIELGEFYNQNSILVKPKGDKAYLYGTNNADFPGYHQQTGGKDYHALAGRFMSRVGKAAFSFADQNKKNIVMRQDKNDVQPGDDENWDNDFLFRNDVARPFPPKEVKAESVQLSKRLVEGMNNVVDSMLDVRENYKGFKAQNLTSVVQMVNEEIDRTRKYISEKRKN